jgi:hypothetical protein
VKEEDGSGNEIYENGEIQMARLQNQWRYFIWT